MSKPKSYERFTRDEDGKVDEVVVGVPAWLHVERMRKRTYWMRLGETHYWVRLRKDGSIKSIYQEERE
jgi:hypothetical protein